MASPVRLAGPYDWVLSRLADVYAAVVQGKATPTRLSEIEAETREAMRKAGASQAEIDQTVSQVQRTAATTARYVRTPVEQLFSGNTSFLLLGVVVVGGLLLGRKRRRH